MPAPRPFDSDDWFDNIRNLPKSNLLSSIKSHLFFNTAWALLVSIIHGYSHAIDDMHISTIPHSIMASALGLLLVFRSNSSYDRWWEARKVWGSVTNTVRNTARLAHISMKDEPRTHDPFIEYLRAFPWLLKQHLQDTRNDAELEWLNLPAEEFERLQSNPNPPLFACERMTALIQQAYGSSSDSMELNSHQPIVGSLGYAEAKSRVQETAATSSIREDRTSVFYRIQLEKELNILIDCLGMCERILGTPVPRSYSRHTSRFLTLYLATLPVVLVTHLEYWTAFVVGCICWGLLSIEAIAYYIEQPFDPVRAQLPLSAYATKMSADIKRMADHPPLPAAFTDDLQHDEEHFRQSQSSTIVAQETPVLTSK